MSKSIKYILIISFFLSINNLSAQYNHCSFGWKVKLYYTRQNFNTGCKKGDTLEVAFIKNRYQFNLNKIAKGFDVKHVEMKGKGKLIIPLRIPMEFINHYKLQSFYLKNIKSDTMFKNFKTIYFLSYNIKKFDNHIFKCDSLYYLYIGFKNGNLSNLISKDNNYIYDLNLVSRQSQIIDSSLLYFKKLKKVYFNFNPFIVNQYEILNSIDSLKSISVSYYNFKDFKINDEQLKKLEKYKFSFLDCKFTREQKLLLKKYRNIKIW